MYIENKRRYRGQFAAVEAHRDTLYFVVPHSASERIEHHKHAVLRRPNEPVWCMYIASLNFRSNNDIFTKYFCADTINIGCSYN